MLADFASSEAGKAFARVEQYWGRDPAASLESVDDVLAHNLRAALVITLGEEEPSDEHADTIAATKAAGERIRAIANG